MYVITELKVNRFQHVDIPSPRSLFAKAPIEPKPYQGSTLGAVGTPVNCLPNKLQVLELGQMSAEAADRARAGKNPEHVSIDVRPDKL